MPQALTRQAKEETMRDKVGDGCKVSRNAPEAVGMATLSVLTVALMWLSVYVMAQGATLPSAGLALMAALAAAGKAMLAAPGRGHEAQGEGEEG